MLSKISRRGVIAGAAGSVSAACTPAIAAPCTTSDGAASARVEHADARLFALWQRRREAAAAARAAEARYLAAEQQLPPWARPGVIPFDRRQAEAEQAKVNLPALDAAFGAAGDRRHDLEDEIQQLQPATPNVLAALALITIARHCDGDDMAQLPKDGMLILAIRLLDALRPALRGAIAEEAAELLDNPDKPICQMALWPHAVSAGWTATDIEALNARTTRWLHEDWHKLDEGRSSPCVTTVFVAPTSGVVRVQTCGPAGC